MYNKDNLIEDEPLMVREPSMSYEVKSSPVFTKYQMQILESVANVQNEDEMRDIRNLIAEYFSNKALDAMDKLCEIGDLSTEKVESWNKEHLRTPYIY